MYITLVYYAFVYCDCLLRLSITLVYDVYILEAITIADVTRVLPFGNIAVIIEVSGKNLRNAFEYSVSGGPKAGRFLQVSGEW